MPTPDLILYNAKVYALSQKMPEAQAIAIKSNKIAAVGSNAQILKLKTQKTLALDLNGKTVLPGFIDCHVHMRSYAKTLNQVEVRDVTSIRQLQQKLRQACEKKPTHSWITAQGFDEEKFREKRLPTRFDIDKAVIDRPVFITRVCGHLSVANTKALRLACITGKTAVEDGIIEKDPKNGEPTGVLLENAQNLVATIIPEPDEKELLRIYERACEKAVERVPLRAAC